MRRSIILIALFSITTFLNAQNPNISLQKTFGASKDDKARDMIQLSNGDLVICATSDSDISGDKTENGFGGNDYWIFQTTLSGNIVWQITLGGSGNETGYSIIQTSDGGFLVNGNSQSAISGNKTVPNYGGIDSWVVKLSAMGQLEWQKSFGGLDNDIAGPMLALPNGNYLICNSSFSGVSGTKTEPAKGVTDYWVLTIDNLGNVVNEMVYGGVGSEYLKSVSLLPSNNILFTGSSNSDISGDKLQNGYGANDYWSILTDINGTIINSSTEGGDEYDDAQSVVSRNSEMVVFGTSDSDVSGSKALGAFGLGDFWVISVDENLNRKWEAVLGGANWEGVFGDVGGVYYNAINQYVFCGSSLSDVSGNKTIGAFDVDYGDLWVVGLDTLGIKQFEFVAGGDGQETYGKIIESNKNTLYVIGLSNSDVSGNKAVANNGGTDLWWIELDFNVGIEKILNNTDLKAYPNPTKRILNFSIPMNVLHSEVSLIDMAGKVVYHKQLEMIEEHQIDVSILSEGIYVLNVISEEFQYTRKVIIE